MLFPCQRASTWCTLDLNGVRDRNIFHAAPRRSGSAPLEFVLVLFAMAWLFLMVLWMGAVWTNQASAVVAARYEAWAKRDSQGANPFELKDFNQGEVSGVVEYPIHVSPIVDDLITPRSTHAIFAGTWQHPHVDLNRSPNRELYTRLVEKAMRGRATELGDVVTALGKLPDAISQQVAEQVNPLEKLLDSQVGELTFLERGTQTQIQQAQTDEQAESREAIETQRAGLQKRIEQEERSLARDRDTVRVNRMKANEAAVAIKKEQNEGKPDQAKIKQLEESIKRLNDESDKLEIGFPKREQGIKRLKQADQELQNSLAQVNGT